MFPHRTDYNNPGKPPTAGLMLVESNVPCRMVAVAVRSLWSSET